MAKSAEQIKQSAANKAQKYVSWNNTDYTTTPNTSASELAAEKAKAHALENKHNALSSELAAEKASLEGKHEDLKKTHINLEKAHADLLNQKASLEGNHTDLKKTHENLKNEYDNFKTNCLSDDKDTTGTTEDSSSDDKDTTGTTEDSSSDNKDKEDGGKLEFPNKIGYNLTAPIIKKIKAEFFLSDDKGDEVKKCHATSISHKKSNDKCFEIDDHNLKSTESDNCEKIYSLHTFLDSIGMDKNEKGEVDGGYKEFLNFITSDTLDEKHKSSFNKLYEDYVYTCQKGEKVPIKKATAIKYKDAHNPANDKECFKMAEGKITTYGENSFSDKCTPIIQLYKMTQEDDIPHYTGYNLKDYDDTEIHKISHDYSEFSGSDAAGAL